EDLENAKITLRTGGGKGGEDEIEISATCCDPKEITIQRSVDTSQNNRWPRVLVGFAPGGTVVIYRGRSLIFRAFNPRLSYSGLSRSYLLMAQLEPLLRAFV